MAKGHPKRPRDLNQWAKHMVDLTIGALPEADPTEPKKDPNAVHRGRLGGLKGGKVRAERMTAAERKTAATKAVKARWSRREQS